MKSDSLGGKRKHQAKLILDAISHELKDEFERSKDILLNTNTKGGEYENVVGRMLGTYLGSRFEFHTRAQLIDVNMEYLNIFSLGGNEVDVVATFVQTYPTTATTQQQQQQHHNYKLNSSCYHHKHMRGSLLARVQWKWRLN